MLSLEHYEGREQSYVKHFVLENYLERLAYKIGQVGYCINYVDGFSGPWQHSDEALKDTSPYIAVDQLGKVRRDLAERRGIHLSVRCMFVEKLAASFDSLSRTCWPDPQIDVTPKNGEFESLIPEVLRFVSQGQRPFSFVFIDPTGWTGYGLNAIEPLLRHAPGEVLINFMTEYIVRFVDDESSRALPTFVDLYGSEDYRSEWKGLAGPDREDAIVRAYCDRVRKAGNYRFAVSAVIVNPLKSRTHYHLIYATRSIEGLRVFREVERKAMSQQEHAGALASERERMKKTRQLPLFDDPGVLQGDYSTQLLERYLRSAETATVGLIRERGRILFGDLEAFALSRPMTCTRDLRDWLKVRKGEEIGYEGLGESDKVPKAGRPHYVVWTGQ